MTRIETVAEHLRRRDRLARRNARERARYAADPDYRKRRYETTRRWLEKKKSDPEYTERRRAKAREAYRRRQAEQPLVQLIRGAKARSKALGVPFDLKPEDVDAPEMCPALGVPLRYGGGSGSGYPDPNSASIDRLRPERGYVSGNVRIISHLANQIKSSASLEQIEAVAAWLRKELNHDPH